LLDQFLTGLIYFINPAAHGIFCLIGQNHSELIHITPAQVFGVNKMTIAKTTTQATSLTMKQRFAKIKSQVRDWYIFSHKKAVALSIVFTPHRDHPEHETDGLLRMHGYSMSQIGQRHQMVRCMNMDNGFFFDAKVSGLGSEYNAKSKKVVVLSYDQRAYLGLEYKAKNANIAVYPVADESRNRREELQITRIILVATLIGLGVALQSIS